MNLSVQNEHDLETQAQCQLGQGLKRQKVSQSSFSNIIIKLTSKINLTE